MRFWLLRGFDALIGAVILYFFFRGLADGSVSAFNIALWIAVLAALAAVTGGSLWLRSVGKRGLATVLLLILALPGLLFAMFLTAVLITNPRWN